MHSFIAHLLNILRMKFKIDTKEVFHVISIEESGISANMAGELQELITESCSGEIKNIALNLREVTKMDGKIIDLLVTLQDQARSERRSFVVCELSEPVKADMKQADSLELINYAPTESEAWDIIQMEEIERELDTEN